MDNQRVLRYLILIVLLVALGEFFLRGPVRTIQQGTFTDFSVSYVASRQWLSGLDPYQSSQFKAAWVAAGGEPFAGTRGSETNLRAAYPPSSFPVLCFFALFRWLTARDLFLLSAVALFPVMLWSALRLEVVNWKSNEGLLVCAFAVALAPWHAAIAWQSISAQAIELALIGSSLRSQAGGGLVTGLALCLKPQLAAWFVIFELAKKRWRRVLSACILFGLVTLCAVSRMPSGWLKSYSENLRYFFAIGGVNDFTSSNSIRFDLLNLQVMFYYLTQTYQAANVLAWVVTGGLVLRWSLCRHRSDTAQLAAIVLIGLLPVYQRTYNAAAVVLVLPYAISRWSELRGKLLIAGCGVFLIPGTAILQTLHQRGWIGDAVWNRSWWFNLFVGPHATWAIIGLVAILLFWKEKKEIAST
jgi:hypothetical protein